MVVEYVTLYVKKEFHIHHSYVHFVLEDLHAVLVIDVVP